MTLQITGALLIILLEPKPYYDLTNHFYVLRQIEDSRKALSWLRNASKRSRGALGWKDVGCKLLWGPFFLTQKPRQIARLSSFFSFMERTNSFLMFFATFLFLDLRLTPQAKPPCLAMIDDARWNGFYGKLTSIVNGFWNEMLGFASCFFF